MRSSTHVLHPRAQNRGHHTIDFQKEEAHGKTLRRTTTLGGRNGASANQTNAGSVLKGDLWETSEARGEAQELSRKSAILTEMSPRVLCLQRRRQECNAYRDVAKSAIPTETSPRVLYLQRRRQECYTYGDVAKSVILTETSPRVLYLQRRRQECYIYLQRCRHLRKKCDAQVRKEKKKTQQQAIHIHLSLVQH